MNDTSNEQTEENDDVVYDEDHGAELVKKLRTRLKKCEQEKKEYLDGWQRLKADTLNARKQHTEALTSAKERATSDFVITLLPTLDSFNVALQGDTWKSVDETWRVGIEHVHTQLLASLKEHGVVSYTAVGDIFDPALHEAIAHEEGGAEGTIARVERHGYKLGDAIVRAAQVVVYS